MYSKFWNWMKTVASILEKYWILLTKRGQIINKQLYRHNFLEKKALMKNWKFWSKINVFRGFELFWPLHSKNWKVGCFLFFALLNNLSFLPFTLWHPNVYPTSFNPVINTPSNFVGQPKAMILLVTESIHFQRTYWSTLNMFLSQFFFECLVYTIMLQPFFLVYQKQFVCLYRHALAHFAFSSTAAVNLVFFDSKPKFAIILWTDTVAIHENRFSFIGLTKVKLHVVPKFPFFDFSQRWFRKVTTSWANFPRLKLHDLKWKFAFISIDSYKITSFVFEAI